jgi:hypothetical protein
MSIDQVRINGFAHSWASIIAKVDGDRIIGFDMVEYGDKIEETQTAGMGKSHAPIRRSKGKYTTEPGKLRGFKSSIQALRAALAAKAADGKSYGTVTFLLVVQFIEAGDTDMTVRVEECRLTDDKASHDEATTDPLKEEVGYTYMRIKRNGLTLYDSSEE